MQRVSGRTLDIRARARRPGDVPAMVAAADKIREKLGWEPRYDDIDTIVAPRARLGDAAPGEAQGGRSEPSAGLTNPFLFPAHHILAKFAGLNCGRQRAERGEDAANRFVFSPHSWSVLLCGVRRGCRPAAPMRASTDGCSDFWPSGEGGGHFPRHLRRGVSRRDARSGGPGEGALPAGILDADLAVRGDARLGEARRRRAAT